jgi:hypothetical protein
MGVDGQRQAPSTLPPGKRADTLRIGGWVGFRAGLDGYGKSRPPPEFDPRTTQPLASRYTDYAIPTRAAALDEFLILRLSVFSTV